MARAIRNRPGFGRKSEPQVNRPMSKGPQTFLRAAMCALAALRQKWHGPKILLWLCSASAIFLLIGCEKSSPDSQNQPKPDSASEVKSSALIAVKTESGIEMVSIPGGEFVMGSDRGNPDEAPPHKVRVSAFLIDKFEVT